MEKKKVLGKGLDAIIPDKGAASSEFVHLPLEEVAPNKYQPREEFTQEEMDELMHSMRHAGILQPIVVRRVEDGYQIVAGGRRFEAARRLGWEKIPAVIKDNVTDKDSLMLAIVENLQRQNLNPLEEAYGYKRLMDEFSAGLQELADSLGKDKSSISNTLRLLKLPDEIKEALRRGVINKGQARTILSLENEQEQVALFYKIINEELTVRRIEEEVRRRKGKRGNRRAEGVSNPFIQEIEQVLQEKLGTKVTLVDKNHKGKIVIEYYSEEDLERVALLIKNIPC